MFGAPAPTATTAGLFGAPPPTATTAGFFGAPPPAATAAGLFGAPPPAATTAGLFGAPPPTASTAGMFGTPIPTATTAGLFGAPPPTASTAGLFGGGTGTLFGATAPATTATAGGLFAASTSATLFGSTAPPAATNAGLFGSGTTLFGAPNTVAQTFGMGATAGFPFTVSQPAVTTTNVLSLGPLPVLSTASGPSLVGLGGAGPVASTSAGPGLSGLSGSTAPQSFTKPKDTPVPDILLALVNGLRDAVKQNYRLAEEMTTVTDPRSCDAVKVDADLTQLARHLKLAGVRIQHTAAAVRLLKDDARADLRQGEAVHRLAENPYSQQATGAVIDQYFHTFLTNSETLLALCSKQVAQLEDLFMSKRRDQVSAQDIVKLLRRLEQTLAQTAARVYEVHMNVKDVKDAYVRFRRTAFGDTKDPFTTPRGAQLQAKPTGRLEGPSPFSNTSNAAILAMATVLSKTPSLGTLLTGGGATTGTLQQTSGGLFGSAPQPGSLFQPSALSGTGATFAARPNLFGSSTTTTSAAPNFGSLFPTTAATGTTTAGSILGSTSQVQSLRFSTPFNTSSSGTLFGGSAANVAQVKPLGVASPMTSGGTDLQAEGTFQLQNPPLGTKRGKR